MKAQKNNSLAQKRKKDLIFYCCLIFIPLLQVAIFYIGVNFRSILLSFQEFRTDGITYEYIIKQNGVFGNFKDVFVDLFTDAAMLVAMKNSAIAYVSGIIIVLPLALVFSYYIMKKLPGSKFFRVILFMPSIICVVALTYIYSMVADQLVPEFIKFFSDDTIFKKSEYQLLANADTRFGAVLFYGMFFGFATNVLMYSSAMSGVSEEMIEAAHIDGITDFGELIHIIIPSIFPTLTTFLVVGVAGFFTGTLNLVEFYGGSADFSVSTIGYYMYKETALKANPLVAKMNYPYLSAMGLVFTLFAAPMTLLVKYLLTKYGPSEE